MFWAGLPCHYSLTFWEKPHPVTTSDVFQTAIPGGEESSESYQHTWRLFATNFPRLLLIQRQIPNATAFSCFCSSFPLMHCTVHGFPLPDVGQVPQTWRKRGMGLCSRGAGGFCLSKVVRLQLKFKQPMQ